MVEELQLLTAAGRPGFLRPGPVEVGDLTAELLAKARALTERPWRLEAAGWGWIVADRQRLTQAVMQLAANAVRHGRRGSPLWLGSAVRDGEALLWVRDHGPGIPEADRGRIFERFARGDAAATPTAPGWGWRSSRRSPRPTTAGWSWPAPGVAAPASPWCCRPGAGPAREPHPDRRGRAAGGGVPRQGPAGQRLHHHRRPTATPPWQRPCPASSTCCCWTWFCRASTASPCSASCAAPG
jgi:hypothetical protein